MKSASFLFFGVISFKKLLGSEHKMFKLAINGIRKKNKAFLKISKIHLVIWHMLLITIIIIIIIIIIIKFWCVLTLLLPFSSLWWLYALMTNFLEDSLSVWLHFLRDNLYYFHEGICFPINGFHGNRKI